jgi:uncharacterized protein YuzE
MNNDIAFRLDVSVCDRTGKVRAAYLQVREGEATETREVVEGRAFADYNSDGMLIGIEFLAPCKVDVVDKITIDEPEPVREFFRSTSPRQLVLA